MFSFSFLSREKKKEHLSFLKDAHSRVVGIPGFEPGMTGPESVVLPLHHIPMLNQLINLAK